MTVTEEQRDDSLTARRAMIDSQLRPSGVNEPWILEAMASTPREDFVPEALRSAAYIDRALPLGNGEVLASPLVHGRMLSEALPGKNDKVLLVGNANGYLAALLRRLVGSIDTITPTEALEQGSGDYSLIMVDGAAEVFPDALAGRLADNGRVVTGQVLRGISRLATGRKVGDHIELLPLIELGVPVLAEFAAPKRWSF